MGDPSLTSATASPLLLRHEGRACSGPDQLVRAAAALAGASVRAHQPCLVLAATDTLTGVRAALGARSPGPAYFDMSVHGRNPARVLPALQSFVDEYAGRHVQFVAEPVGTNWSAAAHDEVELNECIVGLPAFRSWDATLSCLYDTSSLPGGAVDSLDERHGSTALDADGDLARRFGASLRPAPYSARRIGADRTTLGDLRRSVGEFCRQAELGTERTDDFVYAVNESVTNSICHGEGRARVLMWQAHGALWCEVYDRGRIADPLVGRVAPLPGQSTGRGLWLVNQLCDLVQVRSSAKGTYVRMAVDTALDRPPV